MKQIDEQLAGMNARLKRVTIFDENSHRSGLGGMQGKRGCVITNVWWKEKPFHVYRLTYDNDLNSNMPNGHLFVGKFSNFSEAYAVC